MPGNKKNKSGAQRSPSASAASSGSPTAGGRRVRARRFPPSAFPAEPSAAVVEATTKMMAEANITTTTPQPPLPAQQERCTIPTHNNKKALSVPMAVRTLQRAWRRTLAPRTTQRLAEAYDRVLSIEHVRQIRYCCLGCFAPSFGVVLY